MEEGALRLTECMATNISPRLWRGLTLLARLDMTGSILIAAALLLWAAWH
jgi:hypothetical protein